MMRILFLLGRIRNNMLNMREILHKSLMLHMEKLLSFQSRLFSHKLQLLLVLTEEKCQSRIIIILGSWIMRMFCSRKWNRSRLILRLLRSRKILMNVMFIKLWSIWSMLRKIRFWERNIWQVDSHISMQKNIYMKNFRHSFCHYRRDLLRFQMMR